MARGKSMERSAGWSLPAAVLPMVFLASCGGDTQPATPARTDSTTPAAKAVANDGRGAEAATSCLTIDIGQHEFLGDLDFDPAAGSVVLTVNGHQSGKPHPHAKAEAMLNLVVETGTAQVPLAADPLPGDPEGKTSRYKATAPALKGVKALKGRVNLIVDGKAYICDLQSGH
jgi:hypothetical protein